MAKIKAMDNVYAYVPVHFEGDEINDWGSAQQVFCYIHVLYDTYNDLKATLNEVMATLKAFDANKKIYCLPYSIIIKSYNAKIHL